MGGGDCVLPPLPPDQVAARYCKKPQAGPAICLPIAQLQSKQTQKNGGAARYHGACDVYKRVSAGPSALAPSAAPGQQRCCSLTAQCSARLCDSAVPPILSWLSKGCCWAVGSGQCGHPEASGSNMQQYCDKRNLAAQVAFDSPSRRSQLPTQP